MKSCSSRRGHALNVPRPVLPLARLIPMAVVGAFLSLSAALADPIPVRYPEGIVRGFLVLKNKGGSPIAGGDFLQVKRGAEVESRTVFHFKDGSLFDEKVVFTEEGVFSMRSYHLVHKGPAFRQDMTASLERSGQYRVTVKGRGGKEKVYEGKLELPPDTYNGMIPIIAKNLARGARPTVQMVAFTPAPRVLGLELVPSGEGRVQVAGREKPVLHYVLKPRLGLGLKVPAALLGKLPPDNDLWIMDGEVPAFVRFKGPLYPEGPEWQIELTAPRWIE